MSLGFANNKGADQPAHPRCLISSFDVHVLESIISKLVTREISIFKLGSVAEETGFSRILSDTQKTCFEPRHEISKNVVCATSKASDQPAHTRSLIRAFASR